MPLFSRNRDWKLMNKFAQELVDYIIDTVIVAYKVNASETPANRYGESIGGKSYSKGIRIPCLISTEDQTTDTTETGPNTIQTALFAFQRERIADFGYYPEIGDIFNWNDSFYEMDSPVENQLVGGQEYQNHSIVVTAHRISRDSVNFEELRVGVD